MLDMSSWPNKELDVLKEIHLDPENVRLDIDSAAIEADIMRDLFVNEDALSLVDSITKIGYLTHEVPIATKVKNRYVVVEGNRRVAALKAIQNPQLVPTHSARIEKLCAELPDRKSLASIEVKIAPSREDANQLIAALHTGKSRRKWTPARQAAFFQAQVDSGQTLPELFENYPTIDVRKFVFRANMLNRFLEVEYEPPALADFVKNGPWKKGLSTLARIYESKEFLAGTGIEMDSNGELSMAISDPDFDRIAHVICSQMQDGSLNTRTLNSVSTARFAKLMDDIRSEISGRPDTPPAGSALPSSKEENADIKNERHTRPGGKDPRTTETTPFSDRPTKIPKTAFIQVGSLNLADCPAGLRESIKELSALNVRRFPMTTFIATRAVLEKAIKWHAEAHGEEIQSVAKDVRGFVQLAHALKWMADFTDRNGPVYLKQQIKIVQNGSLIKYGSTTDALNAINHNHHFVVTYDEVFSLWSTVESIIKEILK